LPFVRRRLLRTPQSGHTPCRPRPEPGALWISVAAICFALEVSRACPIKTATAALPTRTPLATRGHFAIIGCPVLCKPNAPLEGRGAVCRVPREAVVRQNCLSLCLSPVIPWRALRVYTGQKPVLSWVLRDAQAK